MPEAGGDEPTTLARMEPARGGGIDVAPEARLVRDDPVPRPVSVGVSDVGHTPERPAGAAREAARQEIETHSRRPLKLPIGSTERWLLLVILCMAGGLGLSTTTFFTLPNLIDLANSSAVNIIFGVGLLVVLIAGGIEPDGGERFLQPGLTVANVPQEPVIEGDTVLDHAIAGGADHWVAEAELEAFGLEPSKSTHGLSGGEIRRAALARAFAEGPDLVLLDIWMPDTDGGPLLAQRDAVGGGHPDVEQHEVEGLGLPLAARRRRVRLLFKYLEF